MLSQIFFFLTASAYLSVANLLVPLPRTLTPRDDFTDCQNVTLGLNASCWDIIPRNVGMESWLNKWNQTTTTCQPGELWANCFMRLAGVTSNYTEGVRCDLIGPDVCPEPSYEVFASASAEASYGMAAIWALQQYLTNLFQFLTGEEGATMVADGFLNQTVPRSSKPIIINILNEIGDPVAKQLTILLGSPVTIKQKNLLIPSQDVAQTIVGQTVGYLLQYLMTAWIDGAFTLVSVEGNLISILAS